MNKYKLEFFLFMPLLAFGYLLALIYVAIFRAILKIKDLIDGD